MEGKKDLIYIIVKAGMVQAVYSKAERPVKIVVVDYDVAGGDTTGYDRACGTNLEKQGFKRIWEG